MGCEEDNVKHDPIKRIDQNIHQIKQKMKVYDRADNKIYVPKIESHDSSESTKSPQGFRSRKLSNSPMVSEWDVIV